MKNITDKDIFSIYTSYNYKLYVDSSTYWRELVARDEEGEEASNEESDEELEGFI